MDIYKLGLIQCFHRHYRAGKGFLSRLEGVLGLSGSLKEEEVKRLSVYFGAKPRVLRIVGVEAGPAGVSKGQQSN